MLFSKRTGDTPDHELVARISEGDERAFEALLKRHQGAVYAFAFQFLNDAAEAADVAQETFLRLYESALRFRSGASVRPYLMRIARNLCIDLTRRQKPVLSEQPPEQASGETPHSALVRKQAHGALAEAMQELPESQRTAMLLRHQQDMRYSQIAEAMNTSVRAVESLLVRARKTLKARLEARETTDGK